METSKKKDLVSAVDTKPSATTDDEQIVTKIMENIKPQFEGKYLLRRAKQRQGAV